MVLVVVRMENLKKNQCEKKGMFNWFKKKEVEPTESKFDQIHSHLKSSFSLVKQDVGEIGSWVKELHEKHETHKDKFDTHEKRLQKIERQLEEIYLLLDKEEEVQKVVLETDETGGKDEFNFKQVANAFSSMRGMEKEVFKRLAKLYEEKGKTVNLRELAAEVYPGKDYERVRTALANHISALELFNFVYRQRVGREVYLSVSEKGENFLKKIDAELKINRKKDKIRIKTKR